MCLQVDNLVDSLINEFLELKDEDEALACMDQVPAQVGGASAAQKVSGMRETPLDFLTFTKSGGAYCLYPWERKIIAG